MRRLKRPTEGIVDLLSPEDEGCSSSLAQRPSLESLIVDSVNIDEGLKKDLEAISSDSLSLSSEESSSSSSEAGSRDSQVLSKYGTSLLPDVQKAGSTRGMDDDLDGFIVSDSSFSSEQRPSKTPRKKQKRTRSLSGDSQKSTGVPLSRGPRKRTKYFVDASSASEESSSSRSFVDDDEVHEDPFFHVGLDQAVRNEGRGRLRSRRSEVFSKGGRIELDGLSYDKAFSHYFHYLLLLLLLPPDSKSDSRVEVGSDELKRKLETLRPSVQKVENELLTLRETCSRDAWGGSNNHFFRDFLNFNASIDFYVPKCKSDEKKVCCACKRKGVQHACLILLPGLEYDGDSLWVPLGEEQIAKWQLCLGLDPLLRSRPSRACRERYEDFLERKKQLEKKLEKWKLEVFEKGEEMRFRRGSVDEDDVESESQVECAFTLSLNCYKVSSSFYTVTHWKARLLKQLYWMLKKDHGLQESRHFRRVRWPDIEQIVSSFLERNEEELEVLKKKYIRIKDRNFVGGSSR